MEAKRDQIGVTIPLARSLSPERQWPITSFAVSLELDKTCNLVPFSSYHYANLMHVVLGE